MAVNSLVAGVSIAGLLLFGTITSLFAKIVYELQAEGKDGEWKFYHKPWAMSTLMFLGMSLLLPVAFIQQGRDNRRRRNKSDLVAAAAQPLLDKRPESDHQQVHTTPSSELKQVALLAIPTAFDLLATVLMNIGLLTTTASVYQMMRGAEMLFAALFAVLFLHRRLNRFHFAGLGACVVGISMVGVSSTLNGEGSASQATSQAQILLGILLIIASQAVQAAQVTFEDYFMTDLAIPPLKIVGYEGLLGCVLMGAVMLPLVQVMPGRDGGGIHEDSVDTWHMITHSRHHVLLVVLLVDMGALCGYNLAGMQVTGSLGAVHRTVLETMRTVFVWLVDLALYYSPLGGQQLGESWSVWSFMQLAGFMVLVAGTFLYGQGHKQEALDMIQATAQQQRGEPEPETPPAIQRPSHPHRPSADQHGLPSGPIAIGSGHGHPSSYKATMNLTAGSYHAEVAASYRSGGMHGLSPYTSSFSHQATQSRLSGALGSEHAAHHP